MSLFFSDLLLFHWNFNAGQVVLFLNFRGGIQIHFIVHSRRNIAILSNLIEHLIIGGTHILIRSFVLVLRVR